MIAGQLYRCSRNAVLVARTQHVDRVNAIAAATSPAGNQSDGQKYRLLLEVCSTYTLGYVMRLHAALDHPLSSEVQKLQDTDAIHEPAESQGVHTQPSRGAAAWTQGKALCS